MRISYWSSDVFSSDLVEKIVHLDGVLHLVDAIRNVFCRLQSHALVDAGACRSKARIHNDVIREKLLQCDASVTVCNRPEEGGVGKECVSRCESGCWRDN